MIRVRISPQRAVNARLCIRLKVPPHEAWAAMQAFSRLLAADPYHTRVTDGQGNTLHAIPPRGTALRIGHGIGLTVFERVGTIVYIKPGRGFAFTDLSKRGRNIGFPHVFRYQLVPIGEGACDLRVSVRGRWSAQWIPRAVGQAWLWWVMAQARIILHAHMANELKRMRPVQAASSKVFQ